MTRQRPYFSNICVCPNCFPGYGFDVVIQLAVRAGIHRVSLSGKWKDSLPDLKELLRENRIEVPMVETAEAIGASGSDRLVRNSIDFCVELGVPLLNIACVPRPESEEQKRNARSVLRDCARYAAAAGIRLTLETYGGMSHNARECLYTLEQIGEPNIGINYDTGNVLLFSPALSGTNLAEKDLRLLTGHLWAMHLKDFRRETSRTEILGRGDIDFPALFRILDEMNFSGVLGLDLETSAAARLEDHFTALQGSLRYLEDYFQPR